MIPAGAAETKLTSVYASYAAEGHTNAPIEDDVFEAKSDSITVSIMTTTDMHGRAYDWNSYTNSFSMLGSMSYGAILAVMISME